MVISEKPHTKMPPAPSRRELRRLKEAKTMRLIHTLALSAITIAVTASVASAQWGPVGRACKSDIAELCGGRPHRGETRICLERNYDRVSAACKRALDTTGGGRGWRRMHR
jgi:hypothetical protein